jgi:hypothetical protein
MTGHKYRVLCNMAEVVGVEGDCQGDIHNMEVEVAVGRMIVIALLGD